MSALFALARPAAAQTTGTKTYGYDNRKGYAMCAVPNKDESVMVGTAYLNLADARNNYIRFLHITKDGTPIDTRIYDIMDEDERAMDIDAYGTDDFLITTLHRDPDYAPEHVLRDVIRMIRVHLDGTIIAEREVGTAAGGGLPAAPEKYVNLYPINTIISGTNAYIVGYATQQPTASPSAPLWGGANLKQIGFVMRYNIPGNGANLYRWFNTPGTTGTGGVQPSPDCDVLLRVGILQSGPHQGDLIITGMCNINIPDPIPIHDAYACGSYVAIIPLSMSPTATIDRAFIRSGALAASEDIKWEGATGWIKQANGSDDNLYITGNYFNPGTEDVTTGGRWPDAAGDGWWVNRLRMSDLGIETPGLYPSRAENSVPGSWAVSTLRSLSYGQGVVAGLLDRPITNCQSTPYVPSPNSIQPFLMEIAPGFSLGGGIPGISVSPNFYTIHHTATGTGILGSANSFETLGGGFANLMEEPVSATRVTFSGFNEIALTTSIFNPTSSLGYLNPKFIRINSAGQNLACPTAYSEECFATFDQTDILSENQPGTDVLWNSSIGGANQPLNTPIATQIP